MLRAFIFILILSSSFVVHAQLTAFTYQGTLNTSGSPANGNHDFEFRIFDAPSGGTQIGSTQTRPNVAVTNGTFSVQLDFGGLFTGEARFMEIAVQPAGGPSFTVLTPRTVFTSAPYAIKSLASNVSNLATNATQLGGVPASQYVVTTDPRMTDARSPSAGSGNYVQNQNAGVQPSSNFSISGNGTAGGTLSGNLVNAATQYNIAGSRMLAVVGLNNSSVFVGPGAGLANGFRDGNTFAGSNAGNATTQANNSFFGSSAGRNTTTGSENSFFGFASGTSNATGTGLTLFGSRADVTSDNLLNANAIGFRAAVGASHSLVLGGISGVNGCDFFTGCDSVNVGIGTTTPVSRLHVVGGSDAEAGSGGYIVLGPTNAANIAIDNNEIMARLNGAVAPLAINADGGNVNLIQGGTGNVGIGTSTPDDKLHVSGIIRVTSFGSAGSTALCRNASFQLSTCSSSLRYKTNLNPFRSGLDLVNRLKPITFDWKEGGMHDLGFGAEDVAAVEPLLATYNKDGQVEGVKYDRIGVVLVNAVKEQQEQIEAQADTIRRQQYQIDALTKLVCASNPKADICKEGK